MLMSAQIHPELPAPWFHERGDGGGNLSSPWGCPRGPLGPGPRSEAGRCGSQASLSVARQKKKNVRVKVWRGGEGWGGEGGHSLTLRDKQS